MDTRLLKCMTESEAKNYLSTTYPEADIFTGVINGGMNDVMVAEQYNPNAGEFEDEFTDLEVVIIG